MSVKNLLVRYNGILGERVAERQLGMRTWVGDCIDTKSKELYGCTRNVYSSSE